MTKPFTIVQSTRNAAGSELLMEMPEFSGHVRSVIDEQARRLTADDLDGARYAARMTLMGVTKNTRCSDVSIADLRFLVDQVVDLDFYDAAPQWAQKACDSIADRRKFDERYVNHMLSAIRCIKGINARCEREVSTDEARRSNKRKFG
jgi:hypothetical protein